MLALVRQHLPIGQEDWKVVSQQHSLEWPHTDRCYNSVRKKFYSYASARMPTGDPNCPPNVVEAKRIVEAIKSKADIETFDSTEEEVDEVTGSPESESQVSSGTTPTDANISSPTPTQNVPVVVPRLQRISTPRKRTSPEDMSVQEFFKYSLIQREQDRKDREERERMRELELREERLKRDADERMFRNMFMAVLMRGNFDEKNGSEDKSNL